MEFALIAPVLAFMLIGMFDYGSAAYKFMEVKTAAQAGAEYALLNGWNSSAVQSAVTSATTLAVTASPAPQLAYGCESNGAITFTTGSTCASGGIYGSYVVVDAQAPFSPIIPWPSIVLPTTLSAQAVVRIK